MTANQADKKAYHRYPFWSPRFWHGMRLTHWLRLLARNRFAVHPLRWPMALAITVVTAINSLLRIGQRLVFGRRLARTEIEHPPVFIIGHWRSGTTYLHELFVLDERFTSPSTCQCFTPHHFLLTSGILTRWFGFLLPSKRPMDNVPTGWDRPQEDEFALLAMGAASPYLTMAFPNRPPACQEYLDMQGLPAEEIERWQRTLREFLTTITYQENKPIVLKSPPHTGRVKVLLEMFPDARFVHIVRDPYVLFPSTLRLWKSLYESQAFQLARHVGLEELVFDSFERMYAAFERDRALLGPSRLAEVRYEDLVQDPVGQMRRIYDTLELEGFDRVQPKLEEMAARQSGYRTNRYELTEDAKAEIRRRWGDYLERYHYADQAALPGRADLA